MLDFKQGYKQFQQFDSSRNQGFDLGFMLVFVTFLFFFLGYHTVWEAEPFGIHFIRQTDGISFVNRYFEAQSSFWQPSIHNLMSDEGKAACEFPVIYYLCSLFYHVFGEYNYTLKIVNLVISFSGLMALYFFAKEILKSRTYGFLVVLLLLSSTVYHYYAFNYLPDSAALGLVFIGWYFYFCSSSQWKLSYAFLFFTLAGLLKPIFLISPLAIYSYALVSAFFIVPKNKKGIGLLSVYVLSSILLVVAWFVYTYFYNLKFNSEYFATKSNPIWNLDANQIALVWDYVTNYWYSRLFAHSSYQIFTVFLVLALVFVKHKDKKTQWITVFMCLGTIAYIVLFYAQFKDHDYYFLNCLPGFVFLSIFGIQILQEKLTKVLYQIGIQLTLLVLLTINLVYAKNKLAERYSEKETAFMQSYSAIEKHLTELKIPKNEKVIVAPDPSVNASLLLLKRQGFRIRTSEEITPERLEEMKAKDGQHLIIFTPYPEDIQSYLEENWQVAQTFPEFMVLQPTD